MFRYAREVFLRLSLAATGQKTTYADSSDRNTTTRMAMEVVISLSILVASLWGLLSVTVEADVKKYLSGFIGTVVGYWLR